MSKNPYQTVAEIPDSFQLVQDSQDIKATLEHIGETQRIDDVRCLFVKIGDGDYDAVYMCTRYVPLLTARVYQLL